MQIFRQEGGLLMGDMKSIATYLPTACIFTQVLCIVFFLPTAQGRQP